MIVQLDEEPEPLEELNEAILVGFANRVEAEELSLEWLRAIDELPGYLHELLATRDSAKDNVSVTPTLINKNSAEHSDVDRQIFSELRPKALTNLSSWLRGVFEEAWLPSQYIFGSLDLNSGLSIKGAGVDSGNQLDISNGRSRRIDLGKQGEAILTVSLSEGEEELDILIDLRRENMVLLPPNMELASIHPGASEVRAFTPEPQKFLQLRLLSSLGSLFSIRVSVGEICVTEDFQT